MMTSPNLKFESAGTAQSHHYIIICSFIGMSRLLLI